LDSAKSEARARIPVGEDQEKLLALFISAASLALAEMAGAEVVAEAICQKTLSLGDISAVIELSNDGALVLGFPQKTATAFAGQILKGVVPEPDQDMIRDCVGEIANVIGGQAKALLAETPFRLVLSMPTVVAGQIPELLPSPSRDCLGVIFHSDLGEFTMHLIQEK
jgi:CheY-specific phosphatase CheX